MDEIIDFEIVCRLSFLLSCNRFKINGLRLTDFITNGLHGEFWSTLYLLENEKPSCNRGWAFI